MNTDPGRLNVRFVLEAPLDSDDGAGGVFRSWQMEQEFWGELTPLSSVFAAQHGSAVQKLTHSVQFRNGPVLSIDKRLRYGARIFTISHVRDMDAQGLRQTAFVEEQAA